MKIDITGLQFGRLTAISYFGPNTKRQAIWIFSCECGAKKPILASNVQRGLTKSCGCLANELASTLGKSNKRHGHHNSPTYTSYHSMVQRCTNSRAIGYERYGGAGISVCERWLSSFEAFLEDMGERPKGTTLDRKNGKLGYAKENCRWATPIQQNNNLQSNRVIDFNGKMQTVAQWARELDMPDNALRKRLKYMTIIDAMTKPYQSRRSF